MQQVSFEVDGAQVGATLDVALEAQSIIAAVQGTSQRLTKESVPRARAARAMRAGFATVQLGGSDVARPVVSSVSTSLPMRRA